MKPLVSICIPTYNGAAFIAEALDSAIAQTYPNLELVVSDDHSADDTIAIIESYRNKTNIPISIYHHEPHGIGANWNYCVRQAHGDYIKLLFQDDVLHPNCITKMMTMMLNDSTVGLVYGKRTFIFEHLSPAIEGFIAFYGELHQYWRSLQINEGVIPGKHYLKDQALLHSPKNKIGEPSAVLLRKSVFDALGYFREDLNQTLDFEFWYRVMTQFSIGYIAEPLVKFRLHDQQASTINKKTKTNEQDILLKAYYTYLFWYLHPKNQLKLLKLYHPIFKSLVNLKRRLYAN